MQINSDSNTKHIQQENLLSVEEENFQAKEDDEVDDANAEAAAPPEDEKLG